MKLKNEKSSTKEEPQDEKAGAVDQIKKKYGFPISGVSLHPRCTSHRIFNLNHAVFLRINLFAIQKSTNCRVG